MILSMASAPEAKRLRAVVKASVLSLTITCVCPSAVSRSGQRDKRRGERQTTDEAQEMFILKQILSQLDSFYLTH